MQGIDTNVIVYAHRKDLPQHKIATELLESLISGIKPWAIAWPSLYEFYRLVTHPRVFSKPSRRSEALAVISALHEIHSLRILSHGSAHLQRMLELCRQAEITGNLAFDVQIAAIFLEHGIGEIITNDADFCRFSALRVNNPF